jgi:hypothetical protein
MTASAAINQTCSDREIGFNIAHSVPEKWTDSLKACVLSLKELSSAPDCTKRITIDDEQRRVGGHDVTTTGADLLGKRFADPYTGVVWGNCLIRELGPTHWREPTKERQTGEDHKDT